MYTTAVALFCWAYLILSTTPHACEPISDILTYMCVAAWLCFLRLNSRFGICFLQTTTVRRALEDAIRDFVYDMIQVLFDFGLLFAVTQRAEGPSRPHHTSSRHTWSNNNYRICNSVGVSPKMHPEISPVS